MTAAAWLPVTLPFLGAFAVVAAGRWPDVREALSFVTAMALAASTLNAVHLVSGGAEPAAVLVTVLPQVPLLLRIEPLGALFGALASMLWIVNTLYSIGYMRGTSQPNQTRYYAFFAISIGCTLGIAYAGNLFTLFVFYEGLTLCTYPLVTHAGTREAMRAGRTYLGVLLGTSIVLLLMAIVWTWQISGAVDFRRGGILPPDMQGGLIGVLLALYAFGFSKAALMPFHRWLPAAMIAPTPVSALLHAVAVVKAGVFAIIKVVVYVFGLDLLARTPAAGWLVYVAGFTAIASSVVALNQDNLKRRLAYSTIGQLAYIVMGTAMFTAAGIIAAIVYLVGHALAKITLFFAAGSIYLATGKTRVSELRGIGGRMPWTMAAFTITALGMIGLPLTAGFMGKWLMLGSAIGEWHPVVLVVLVVGTLLNAGYYIPIIYDAFRSDGAARADDRGPTAVFHARGEAPWPAVVALVITGIASVVYFFAPGTVLRLAGMTAG